MLLLIAMSIPMYADWDADANPADSWDGKASAYATANGKSLDPLKESVLITAYDSARDVKVVTCKSMDNYEHPPYPLPWGP